RRRVLVRQDERADAAAQARAVVVAGADVRAASLLPALEDQRPDPARGRSLFFQTLVNVLLRPAQVELHHRAGLRPDPAALARVVWEIGREPGQVLPALALLQQRQQLALLCGPHRHVHAVAVSSVGPCAYHVGSPMKYGADTTRMTNSWVYTSPLSSTASHFTRAPQPICAVMSTSATRPASVMRGLAM